MLRFSAVFSAVLCCSAQWLAAGPVTNGAIDLFQMDNNGNKKNDVLSFAVAAGEQTEGGALSCGRCFCLLLTTNPAKKMSYVYNVSFCLVPTPVLNSKLALPGLAYNIHALLGLEGPVPGTGSDGYTILIDHSSSPQRFLVTHVTGTSHDTVVDISPYVDADKANVLPGGTAFCADTFTLWVAISAPARPDSTLISVNVQTGKVLTNISYANPVLTAHIADCTNNRVGGTTLLVNKGVTSVVQGWLDGSGAFTPFDQAALPAADSKMVLAPIAGGFNPFAKGAFAGVLYTSLSPLTLPGLIFSVNPNPTLAPLATAIVALSTEY